MEASDARRLKALEDENTKLKKLLAEAMLDNAMLRDVAAPARSRNANESATEQSNRSKKHAAPIPNIPAPALFSPPPML